MSVLLGENEFFKGIQKIKFEGQESDNKTARRGRYLLREKDGTDTRQSF